MNKYTFLKKYVQTKYHSLYKDWSYIQLVEYFNVKGEKWFYLVSLLLIIRNGNKT